MSPAIDSRALYFAGRPRSVGSVHVLGCAVVGVGAKLAFASSSVSAAAGALVLTLLGCISVLSCVCERGLYSAPCFYLILLGLFHGGVTISAAVRGTKGNYSANRDWILFPDFLAINRLVVVCFVVFALAVIAGRQITEGSRRTRAPLAETEPVPPAAPDRATTTSASAMLLTIGAGLMLSALREAGGLTVLTEGYIPFINAVEGDQQFSYGQFFFGLGFVFGLCGVGRIRSVAWGAFTVYGLTSLYVGLRGAALFPLAAALVLSARRGRVPRPWVLFTASVVLLFLISIIRQTRLGEWSGFTLQNLLELPMDALAEMGSSLYPLFVVHRWREAGEPASGLDTILAIPWNLLSALTGVSDQLETFNQLVFRRVGPIGGSPIAEGYLAGGLLGAMLTLAVIGVVLGRVDARAPSLSSNVWVGVVSVVAFSVVRNALGPAVVQLAVAAVIVVMVLHTRPKRAAMPVAPSGASPVTASCAESRP